MIASNREDEMRVLIKAILAAMAAITDLILAFLRAITGSGQVIPLATPVANLAAEASADDDDADREAEERRREREARRAAAAARRQELPGHVRRTMKALPMPRPIPTTEEDPQPDLEPAYGLRM
jgi:hypothetical protein